jgi:uracil-DNA glycosylase family 4
MSLVLDERRVAMLEQFGIKWQVGDAVPDAITDAMTETLPAAAAEAQAGAAPVAEPRREDRREDRPLAVELSARATGIDLMEWDALAQAVASCRACQLCGNRRNTVFGGGDAKADWLIVGEAPDENEDAQGEAFVGDAGRLLDNMLRALGLDRREKVYITNALKCRPPGNRNPEAGEIAQCELFLRRQVELLQPRIIVAMGRFAVQSLLGTADALGKLRGQRHSYAGVPVVVTYPPEYLLRNLHDKAKAWSDLCLAREIAAQSA